MGEPERSERKAQRTRAATSRLDAPARVSTRPTTARQVAARWLAHPLSLAAIVVMVVNDHVLKAEFGTWWTGKLSDVAGLVFFPALLALAIALVAPRVRPATVMRAALVVTLLGFSAVKATVVGAASASAVLSAIAWPSTVLRDPTDLIALASLPLAAWIATRSSAPHEPGHLTRWRVAVVAPVALLASVATSPAAQPSAVALEEVDGSWMLEVAEARPYEDTVWAVWAEDGWLSLAESQGITEEPQTVEEIEAADEHERLEPTMTSCVEGRDGLCARVVPERLAVEVSDDGGATWVIDWEASEAERESMLGTYGTRELTTTSAAVIETADGPIVIAANGRDGLAIRDVDGTWERVGFEGVPGVVSHTIAPEPELTNPLRPYPLPPAIGWASLGAALGLAVVGCVASWLHYRKVFRLATGAPLLAVAVAAGYWVAAENHHVAVTPGPVPIVGWLLPLMLGAASLFALLLASLLLGAYGKGVAGPAWGAGLTGIVVAGFAGTVVAFSNAGWWEHVAVVAASALMSTAPWLAATLARHHERAARIPVTPPVEPLADGPGAVKGP